MLPTVLPVRVIAPLTGAGRVGHKRAVEKIRLTQKRVLLKYV